MIFDTIYGGVGCHGNNIWYCASFSGNELSARFSIHGICNVGYVGDGCLAGPALNRLDARIDFRPH